jgi:hypothetical protein
MTKVIFTAFAAAAFGAMASTAIAGPHVASGWGCHTCGFKNGTQIAGIALDGVSTGAIKAVILPPGETAE